MAQIQCNFFSYSLGYPVDIQVVLPSFTSCNLSQPHTHRLPGKFPVLYLLHGYGNDYQAWLRYTSVERYAEEHRIAVVTFSCHNKAYQNAPVERKRSTQGLPAASWAWISSIERSRHMA